MKLLSRQRESQKTILEEISLICLGRIVTGADYYKPEFNQDSWQWQKNGSKPGVAKLLSLRGCLFCKI